MGLRTRPQHRGTRTRSCLEGLVARPPVDSSPFFGDLGLGHLRRETAYSAQATAAKSVSAAKSAAKSSAAKSYSNKARGIRKRAEAEESVESSSPGDASTATPALCSQTWAMLIKRVYEIDPMVCPKCGGQMKVVAFIEPPRRDVIEKILRHCGPWQSSAPRGPPDVDRLVHALDYVDIDTFLATF